MKNCGDIKPYIMNEDETDIIGGTYKKIIMYEVIREIYKGNTKVVLLKGAWYESALYKNRQREYGDIDLFVIPEYFKEFDKMMKRMGYTRALEGKLPPKKYYLSNDAYYRLKS